MSHHGLDGQLLTTIIAGILLSAATPLLAFGTLRLWTPFDRVDAAAIAGHYGSISAVTFLDHAHGRTTEGMLKQIIRVSRFWRVYAGELATTWQTESDRLLATMVLQP